jgi:predicted carbohydrate-binding protein with CBM5 and CBM33 domain
VKLLPRAMAYSAAAILAAGLATFVGPGAALAHGAMMKPGSRTYLCWQDGLTASGEVKPQNPACQAAVAQSGVTSLYNWFAVLRSDGAGRMAGFIPDGQLCSGGTGGPYDMTGFNIARADYPVTHLTSGATMEIDYNDWAKHPGTFSLYVTKDSWSPTRPLAWGDLESTPFSQVVNPASIGGPGTNDGKYYWNAKLPSGKSGRHIVYSVWSRSDSTETFYGCSDVTFDGGNGEVTGLGGGGGTSPTPSPSATRSPSPSPSTPVSPSSSPSPSSPAPSSPGPGGSTGCTGAYKIVSSWTGGFQGEVTVTNSGSAAIGGWTVKWTLAAGQDITQSWSSTLTKSGSNITVTNAAWNGTLASKASTTFGFIGSYSGSNPVPAVTCATR